MTSDNLADGRDCLALAIEFFHAPSRFTELLHGHQPLPRDMTALLLAAAGNSPAGTEEATRAEELQQAASFFIEQVLLARHANNYRILGLEPGTAIDKIKEHHRLLMRLFHPDRQTTPDARSDAIATRINQAYNVLRLPETRAAYDLTLMDKQAAKPLPKTHLRHRHFVPAPDLPVHPPSFVTRHRTAFALGSIALVATLGVMLVYINRVPTGAIGAGDTQFVQARDIEAPQPSPPALPPAVARALADSSPVAAPPPSMAPAVTEKPSPPPVPAAESRPEREVAAMPSAVKPAGLKLVSLPAAAQKGIQERLPPLPAPEVAAPTVVNPPPAVNPPETPEIKPERLRPDQLNGLVASLAEQYQRGDLENLLELFDASAHMERGDKRQIRAEYGDLFRNSESRALHIWDMAWSGDGKSARGVGNFQASVLRKNDNSPRIYNGMVTIEVIQRNDRPLIVGLYHKRDN